MIIRFDHNKSLRIKPFDDQLSQSWYQEVLKHKDKIFENDRIYGGYKEEDIRAALKKNIAMIKYWKDFDIDTDDLNELHTYFEDMMEEGVFDTAPTLIQKHITAFNLNIHHLESLESRRIVCTFYDREKYLIPEGTHFTFDQKPGTVCINYCHVGKPLYDVYHDNDDVATKIVPQTHWSADFTIIYKHAKHKPFDKKAQKWCDDNCVEPTAWGLVEVGTVVPSDDIIDDITLIERIDYD